MDTRTLQTGSEQGLRDDVTNDVNMDNCLNIVDDTSLAARLADAIEGDSVDDVRAALEQGAPVNFLYKVGFTRKIIV